MKVGTERDWEAARKDLLRSERELEERAKRVEEQRRELPWVLVEKEYGFVTEDGPKSLPELFEGRSQLLIYHLMFGEDWTVACPGCSSLADGLGGVAMHLNDRDVTLICMSHAPLEKLVAYKRSRGWTVPYVSAHGGDFLFDYGYAFRREEMSGIVRDEFDMGQLLREAPQWLRDYGEDVGAPDLESAVSVSAGWSVFVTRDDAVYNTYRVYPHSRLITPLFSGLLELLPNKGGRSHNHAAAPLATHETPTGSRCPQPLPASACILPASRKADDGCRTRDLRLGKPTLYQLSYVRAARRQ